MKPPERSRSSLLEVHDIFAFRRSLPLCGSSFSSSHLGSLPSKENGQNIPIPQSFYLDTRTAHSVQKILWFPFLEEVKFGAILGWFFEWRCNVNTGAKVASCFQNAARTLCRSGNKNQLCLRRGRGRRLFSSFRLFCSQTSRSSFNECRL